MAGSSLYLGNVTELGSFSGGSAVMSSDQPLATTIVQVPAAASGVKSRPLTNGMDTGSTSVQIPTVLANHFGFTSLFSIQNADLAAQNISVQFIPLDAGTAYTATMNAVPSGSGQSFDLGTMAAHIGADFNGSVKITGTGPVVATDIEYQIAGNKAYGFEGTGTGGPKVYMPSAFCKFGSSLINSSYAVQNTNTSGNVSVTVTYTDVSTPPNVYVQSPVNITPGGKQSFPGCGVAGTINPPPAGFIGSAVISATGGNIVAIGKISDFTLGTAYLGFTDAPAKVALPYVRYASNADWPAGAKQRTNIAIQNIGSANLAAGAVTVTYYDKNGVQQGSIHSLGALPVGGKLSSNPTNAGLTSFGFYADGSSGGSAIVQGPAGSKLAVIARVQTYLTSSTTAGEDYNGILAP
jgi:hypothetical protein